VKVALGTSNLATDPQVLLTIRDEGPGVPRDALQNILVPSSVSTGLEGSSKAMGLGWRLRSKPFVCTTGRLSLQISIPQGWRLASGCPLASHHR